MKITKQTEVTTTNDSQKLELEVRRVRASIKTGVKGGTNQRSWRPEQNEAL